MLLPLSQEAEAYFFLSVTFGTDNLIFTIYLEKSPLLICYDSCSFGHQFYLSTMWSCLLGPSSSNGKYLVSADRFTLKICFLTCRLLCAFTKCSFSAMASASGLGCVLLQLGNCH